MARKRYSDEDILKLLREIELKLTAGDDVASACRSVGISDATYYNWRKRFGGMGRAQLSEMKSLAKENARLKKIVAGLESLFGDWLRPSRTGPAASPVMGSTAIGRSRPTPSPRPAGSGRPCSSPTSFAMWAMIWQWGEYIFRRRFFTATICRHRISRKRRIPA